MHFQLLLIHRLISTFQGLHIAVASRQCQGFIPLAMPHAFPLTTPAIHSYNASFSLLIYFIYYLFITPCHLRHKSERETKLKKENKIKKEIFPFYPLSCSLGSIVGGSRDPHSCYSCFRCMSLECARGLACPPSL